MKQSIQLVFILCALLACNTADAQVFKHLRRGAPGSNGNGEYYYSAFRSSTTDTNGNLYLFMVDSFQMFSSTSIISMTCHVETWNGTLWIKTSPIVLYNTKQFSGDVLSPPWIHKMLVHDGMIYIGGAFDSTQNNLGAAIVAWDGVSWVSAGNGLHLSYRYFQDMYQRAFMVKDILEYRNKLVVVGDFDSVPGAIVNGITQLNSSGQWENLAAVSGNAPFPRMKIDPIHFTAILAPEVRVALDSLYFYSTRYHLPGPGGYYGSLGNVINNKEAKSWDFNSTRGNVLYSSTGSGYRPVSVPPKFVIHRLFEWRGQLMLMGHSDSTYCTRQLARRDSSGSWHVYNLPDNDSILGHYTGIILDNYLNKKNLVFAGKLIPDYSISSYVKFYEFDGNRITSSSRIREDSAEYSDYYIHRSGRKKYLTGSFVNIRDASGRVDSSFNHAAEILTTKTMVIKGKAFIDWNLDEVWQSYEPVLRNKIVYWKDSGYSANTDNNGNYVLYVPAGPGRDIRVNLNRYYVPAWTGSKVFSSSSRDTFITSNFPFDVTLDRDLKAELVPYTGVKARRGSVSKYAIRVSNISGKPVRVVDVKVQLNKGITQFSPIGTAAAYDSIRRVASWRFSGTLQGDSAFYLYFNCKYSADSFVFGDTVNTSVKIVNNYRDADTSNNLFVMQQYISSAYDPNIKESNPRGKLTVKPDHIQYTIHFQNEGNDTAIRVQVVDTLDVILPVYEVEVGAASHPFNFSVENNIMVWEFDNIMLPAKSENEQGSCGFLTFTVKINKPIKVGDSVRNRAGIYFDYEKPVITNYASIIMIRDNGNTVQGKLEQVKNFSVFPNPFQAGFTIRNKTSSRDAIKIFSLNGQLLYELNFDPYQEQTVDMSSWAQGVYLLKTESGETIRLLKMQ